jgi:hypothetical protein
MAGRVNDLAVDAGKLQNGWWMQAAELRRSY